jgi:hypothetical protein
MLQGMTKKVLTEMYVTITKPITGICYRWEFNQHHKIWSNNLNCPSLNNGSDYDFWTSKTIPVEKRR